MTTVGAGEAGDGGAAGSLETAVVLLLLQQLRPVQARDRTARAALVREARGDVGGVVVRARVRRVGRSDCTCGIH